MRNYILLLILLFPLTVIGQCDGISGLENIEKSQKCAISCGVSTSLIGDSNTNVGIRNELYSRIDIYDKTRDCGNGYLGFGTNPTYRALATRTGSWGVLNSDCPDGLMVQSSTAADLISVSTVAGQGGSFDAFTIYHKQGTYRYRVDAGAWVTSSSTANVTGLVNSPHTVDIEVVSGTVQLCGIDLYIENCKGSQINKLGKSGATSSNATGWNHCQISSDFYTIEFGYNDQAANVPLATFEANLNSIINDIKACNPDAEFLILGMMDTGATGTLHTAEEYKDAACNVATSQGTAFASLYDLMGAYDGSGATYWAGGADLVHRNSTGGQFVGALVSDILLALY